MGLVTLGCRPVQTPVVSVTSAEGLVYRIVVHAKGLEVELEELPRRMIRRRMKMKRKNPRNGRVFRLISYLDKDGWYMRN